MASICHAPQQRYPYPHVHLVRTDPFDVRKGGRQKLTSNVLNIRTAFLSRLYTQRPRSKRQRISLKHRLHNFSVGLPCRLLFYSWGKAVTRKVLDFRWFVSTCMATVSLLCSWRLPNANTRANQNDEHVPVDRIDCFVGSGLKIVVAKARIAV